MRIGVVIPSSNTVLEREFSQLVARMDGMTLHVSRVPVLRTGAEAESSEQFDPRAMVTSARFLREAAVDVVAWAGTSGSWLGLERDARIIDALEQEVGVPATTSTIALLAACDAFGAERIGLLTPYTDALGSRIVSTYETHGVHVVAQRHLGVSDYCAFGSVPGSVIRQLIQEVSTDEANASMVPCTNLRVTPLVADLEERLSVPVFDSIGVTLWGALQRVGREVSLRANGAVLATGSVRAALSAVCDRLLTTTDAHRVTIRIDAPHLGAAVDRAVAEAAKANIPRIAHDATLDQRGLNTVRWLEQWRVPLIQDNFANEPFPPGALVTIYGVRSQMLSPLATSTLSRTLPGWISVHSTTERHWSADNRDALARATQEVNALLDLGAASIRLA